MSDKIITLRFLPGVCLCAIIAGVYKLGRNSGLKDACDVVDIMSQAYDRVYKGSE